VIDTESFLVIVFAAAVAGTIVAVAAPRFVIPVVVVELILGMLIGPHALDIAQVDRFTDFFGNLGLGMLFFFAGYEIDFERIRGRALNLGHDRVGVVARDRVRSRRRAGGPRHRGVAPLHRLRARDDRDRHADPDSPG
jgi:hypothetical protein